MASVVGQEAEGRGTLELVSVVQVLGPRMGAFVGPALLQHALRTRGTVTWCENLDHVA